MIYLDTPIDKWLKMHPALAEEPFSCECKDPDIVPFAMNKTCRGITCRKCNSGTWVNYDPNWVNLLIGSVE